ncbi:MAG: hypothetical protein M0D53_12900 [Flavobacterium sp. JAD_PAG50586_2]|nr:MAG: hypothetical protein M0D53_12900 [Flavobacterium sp. JAD_PAG50586_2]
MNNFPQDTIIYIRFIIIFGLIMLMSAGIQTVFDSLGKVRLYNIWVSLILMLNLPIAYTFFKLGFPSHTIIIVGMCLELVSLNVRLVLLKKYVAFSIKEFYYDVIFRVFLPTIAVSTIIYFYCLLPLNGFVSAIGTFLLMIIIYPILIYNFSLEPVQKDLLSGMLSRLVKRKQKG